VAVPVDEAPRTRPGDRGHVHLQGRVPVQHRPEVVGHLVGVDHDLPPGRASPVVRPAEHLDGDLHFPLPDRRHVVHRRTYRSSGFRGGLEYFHIETGPPASPGFWATACFRSSACTWIAAATRATSPCSSSRASSSLRHLSMKSCRSLPRRSAGCSSPDVEGNGGLHAVTTYYRGEGGASSGRSPRAVLPPRHQLRDDGS